MNKKGFAVMFDWIFSLVAGVLIFSFLIYFAVQHTDLFGKVTARVVAEELDVLFSGYETTETKSVLDFGKEVELEFKCDNNKQRFKINNREGKNLWGKIIFAPEKIKNKKVNVATMSWDVPFRVANFIFLWNKQYSLAQEGYIPDINFLDNFEKKRGVGILFNVDSSNSISLDPNNPNNDIICPDFSSQYDKIIYYDEDSSGNFKGYVCFEDEDGIRYRSYFFGEAMMIGAMFVDNVENFECLKKIAIERLRIVNDIYEEKINKISDTSCTVGGYNTAVYDGIDDIENFDNKFDFNDVQLVKESNERLIENGCAGLY